MFMKNFTLKTLAASILYASFSLTAQADATLPKHSCAKPEHPGRVASDNRLKQFQKEIDTYRTCITQFIDDQKKQIKNHEDAGANAIDEFNLFVKTDLKKDDDADANRKK
jgi:hypothetical protein